MNIFLSGKIAFASVLLFSFHSGNSHSYEISNHADISAEALLKSTLEQDGGVSGKLSRLGLRSFRVVDPRQTFPLPSALPPIQMCFGVVRDANGAMVPNPNTQPPWNSDVGRTPLSIVYLLRYGACYEDNADAGHLCSVAHFYDPQDGGWTPRRSELSDWMLKLGASSVNSGFHHHKLGIASM